MSNMDLRQFAGLFRGYTELRAQENRSVGVTFVKGNNTSNARQATGGISARVYMNGSWGFSSNPETTPDSVREVVRSATQNASFLDSRERKGKGPLPAVQAESVNDFSTKKPRLDQKALVDFARELDAHVVAKYPGLASRTVNLSCLDTEKTLLTADRSYSYSMIPRSIVMVSLSIEKDGRPVDLGKSFGGLGQFEDVFVSPAVCSKGSKSSISTSREKARASTLRPGCRCASWTPNWPAS